MSGYIGQSAFEYINTGTYALPVWTQIKRLEDVDMPDERSVGEIKTKESDDVKVIPGPRTRSVAFKYRLKRGTDAVFTALKTAYDGKTVIDYMALDQAATVDGAKGIRGPFYVTKFSESRPYENAVEVDVELRVADVNVPLGTTPWEVAAVVMDP